MSNKISITFLGTGSAIPTEKRNHISILLNYKEENILIDCGEGTQRQLRLAKIKPTKLTKILITHFHGDHILGLPGVIQNLSAHNYNKTLEVYGPKGIKSTVKKLMSGIIFHSRLKTKFIEVNPGIFYKGKEFSLQSINLQHGVDCLGYSFLEKDRLKINIAYTKKFGLTQSPILKQLQAGKPIIFKGKKISVKQGTIKKPGKKLTIILDTKPCSNAIKLAKNSDVLIAESTWLTDEKAKQGSHLTAAQAAIIAKKAKAKKLILTHFSQRYKNHLDFEKEAKKIFPNTTAARDFLVIEV